MDYQFNKTTDQIIYAGWSIVNYYAGFKVPEIEVFKSILHTMKTDTPKEAIIRFYDYYQSITTDKNVRERFRNKLFELLDVEPPKMSTCCLFQKVDKVSLQKSLEELSQKISDIQNADFKPNVRLKAG